MLQFSFLYWVIRHYHILNCHILAIERTSDNTLNTGKHCYCTYLKVASLNIKPFWTRQKIVVYKIIS